MTKKAKSLGADATSYSNDFQRYFRYTLGRDNFQTSPHYQYFALALAVRDRLMEGMNNTRHAYYENESRRMCYLSLEYLLGRSLQNATLNLGSSQEVSDAVHQLGLSLEEIATKEHDAGLGNGGLGRLAACFMDSCATLQLPVLGYGIRYHYGMFRQRIEGGYQVEEPDNWLHDGHPWELKRPEWQQAIKFCGHTESYTHANGHLCQRWVNTQNVYAVPYDVPVPGFENGTVNTLRLWSAEATDAFNLNDFNAGSYTEAVGAKNQAENITMVLYPNDASENGRELRLRQQYFLASASLQDTVRQWVHRYGPDFTHFAEQHVFQLNDTHPSIAVAELMRILIDEHALPWNQAWDITTRCVAYTNHTLLPEALEKWSVGLFKYLLPRLLEIIYEINARFLKLVATRWPGDMQRQQRMSLIEEGNEPMIRMAYLAIVGSYSVNGVAALHSELLQEQLFNDFYQLWPDKFNNKTNGVTQRRWMASSNQELSTLISNTIGKGWLSDLEQLSQLKNNAKDKNFQAHWHEIKQNNKRELATLIQKECGVTFNTDMMFDVQVKRIHEYKRQLLNILHVIHLYQRIKDGDTAEWTPRAVLIAGKAAPGYYMAKQIIKLINSVADVINNDPATSGLLRVAFLPNYSVSSMEVISPATDLSEQISTAGKEASGTGNMKFMMNGALTIGTLDGANIEIREAAGEDNFFLFGLDEEQVQQLRHDYQPQQYIDADPRIAAVLKLLRSGHFNQFEAGIFDNIINAMTSTDDPWVTLADFSSFIDAQQAVATAYQDREKWVEMSIINTATSGKFSSDRTIKEYNDEIWKLTPTQPN